MRHFRLQKLRFASFLVILLALLFMVGCVYYNTFYNAKKAFDEAESKVKNARSRSTRIGAAQYNIAIQKSLKVIENYPNSKWYDDALYVLGVSYYRIGQYGKADRRFRELLANYPESKLVRDCELFLAKTKLELKEQTDAMVIFEKIFNSDYDKDFKTEAALGLGYYYYDQQQIDKAIPYFLAIRDSLGNNENKKLAQTYIADGFFEMFRFKEALSAYLQLLGMEPTLEEKYHALFQSGASSYGLMRLDDGMDYINTLLEDEKYFDSTNALTMKLAEGYELEDDLETALELYEKVTLDDAPRNKPTAGMAHYRMGLIYQFDFDQLPEAKEQYDLAKNKLRGKDESKEALTRSSDIGKLETYARTLVIDSSTTQEMIDNAAFTQYQLSELYWFKLNKPDSAIQEMQYLLDSFPTAYDVPKAMISLSEMYRSYVNDTTVADSLLTQMLLRYPNSDFAPQALERLELLGTEADTGYAKRYLDLAEGFLVDDSLIDSAKFYYEYVVDNYPESEYYLQARFAVLWVTEEYDPPGDSSLIMAYQAYIDSFPTSPWTKEARNRLKGTPRRTSPGQRDDNIDEAPMMDSLLQVRDEQIYAQQYGDTLDDTSTYIDPLEALYIDPNGQKALAFNLEPIEIKERFEYPVEAYKDAFEGEIYFQIFLDFTGEVVDYIQKTRTGNDELDREATETVASMTFDPLRVPQEFQGSWLVYKFRVRLPDHLR